MFMVQSSISAQSPKSGKILDGIWGREPSLRSRQTGRGSRRLETKPALKWGVEGFSGPKRRVQHKPASSPVDVLGT